MSLWVFLPSKHLLPLHNSNCFQVSFFPEAMSKHVLKVVEQLSVVLKFSDLADEQPVMPPDVEQQCHILVHQRGSKDLDERR